MRLRDPELRSALSAEYVLGTMTARARRRFEQHLARDPALLGEVDAWQARLGGLIAQVPERAPPERVWQVIARRTAPRARDDRPALLERLGFWRRGAFAGAALALLLGALAVHLALQPPPVAPPPAPETLAVLADAQSRAAWVVRHSPLQARLSVRSLADQPLPPERSFELWMIEPGGEPPRSLGLIPASGSARLALAPRQLAALSRATALAVSIEPAGGSPSGVPTGPIPYQGVLLEPPAE